MRVQTPTQTQPQPQPQAEDGPFLLPRLTLHAFCRSHAVMESMTEACAHERMVRVDSRVGGGGIDGAVQAIRGMQRAPQVIVVEVLPETTTLMADLERLAGVCSGHTRVFVIGHSNDMKLYQRLLREGASDYLLAPLAPGDFVAALARVLAAEAETETLGASVVVLGSRGGVGATTVACNLAYVLAEELALDTVLADLKLPFGAVASQFDVTPSLEHSVYLYSPALLDGPALEQLLVPKGARLKLLTAAPNLEACARGDAGLAFERLVPLLMGAHAMTISDTPLIWSPAAIAHLTQATQIVLVVTPDFAAAANAQAVMRQMRALRGAESRPIVVLNQMGVAQRQELKVTELAEIFGRPARELLTIAHDPRAFSISEQNGRVLSERAPTHDAARVFRALAARVAGRETPPSRVRILRSLAERLPAVRKLFG
ncbi:AAA family ATPase [Aquabacter spiritensis]|uniref:Pilus assembly protein CpaE n=1 Tax=Aquabacter spiritensis TaxID=933073 RepID=A0A4R3M2T1_9HYPH|nr:hypothetical protein [Aquabacter spiritensis]TCT07511.1 pilus assembly protein CpaE [Aquabacter spiritensis]